MIEVKNVTKYFEGKIAIEDISTSFEKGKINMIIGRSGSGKTVLLKCVVGLHEVDSGDILYDGRSFVQLQHKYRKEIRKEIGMVFQGGALFDSLTVLENVMFPLEMFTEYDYYKRRKIALETLERVNLLDVEKKYPSELSGGMQKRVAIARAIVAKPKYLFFDEPNSGLDPITSRLIDNLILEIAKDENTTTVINTHDIMSVLKMGENVVFIHEGHKAWEGPKDKLFSSGSAELEDFLKASGLDSFV